jgi:hypothetical protein
VLYARRNHAGLEINVMTRYFARIAFRLFGKLLPLPAEAKIVMPEALLRYPKTLYAPKDAWRLGSVVCNDNIPPTYEEAFDFNTVLDTKIHARLTETATALVTQISKSFTGHDMPIDRSGGRNLITDVFDLVSLVRGAKNNALNLSDWLAENHRPPLMIVAGRLAHANSKVCQNAAAGLMEILAESPQAPPIIRLHRDAYTTRVTTGPKG